VGVEVGISVAGVILVVAAAALAWRQNRRLRGRTSFGESSRSVGRQTALIVGAFCALVLVVAIRAFQLR
jgi:hypothetical protein